MIRWLNEHIREIHINLWIVKVTIGRRQPAPAADRNVTEGGPPESEPLVPVVSHSMIPVHETEAALDLTVDPALLNEPGPEQDNLDHPVLLQGTAFEKALTLNAEVNARLSHGNHEHVARRAVRFFVDGQAPSDPKDKRTRTWVQIRGATLELIVEILNRHHQRATYGAVGGILGVIPQSVMSGKPRIPRYSWIVSRLNGQPSGYLAEERHPSLSERAQVLNTPNQLRQWLSNPA